jgi:hypothetical protein
MKPEKNSTNNVSESKINVFYIILDKFLKIREGINEK